MFLYSTLFCFGFFPSLFLWRIFLPVKRTAIPFHRDRVVRRTRRHRRNRRVCDVALFQTIGLPWNITRTKRSPSQVRYTIRKSCLPYTEQDRCWPKRGEKTTRTEWPETLMAENHVLLSTLFILTICESCVRYSATDKSINTRTRTHTNKTRVHN